MSKIAIFWVNYLLPRELSGDGKLYFSKVDLIRFPTHQKSFPKINCFRIFSSLKTSCNCAPIVIIHIVTLWGKWYIENLGFARDGSIWPILIRKCVRKVCHMLFNPILSFRFLIQGTNFRENSFSRSPLQNWPYSNIRYFTFSSKNLVCGFNFEISENF